MQVVDPEVAAKYPGGHTVQPWMSGRSSCLDCGAGYFNSITGASGCFACPSGSFQAFSGLDSCTSCIHGTFVAESGQSVCTQCGVGKFSSDDASSSCTDCELGSYQGTIGQTACLACSAGTIAELPGQSSCKNCEQRYWSHPGQAKCTIASIVFYLNPVTLKSERCPHGSKCLGFEYLPQPLKGYWVRREVDRFVGVVYPCPRATCNGVNLQDKHSMSCWKMPIGRGQNCSNAAALLCQTGSNGPLCGHCVSNFVYSSALRICQSCTEASILSLLVVCSLMLFAAVGGGLFFGKISIPARVQESWIAGMLRNIDGGSFRG